MLRLCLNRSRTPLRRSFSSEYNREVFLSRFDENDAGQKKFPKIVQLRLAKKPVNSLNLELLSQIETCLDEAENDESIQAMILTSEVNNIFSAGLDITEMYRPNEERLRTFWTTLQNVWMKLYGSRLGTVAAIQGHAPAGGCLLALSCDYRVMTNNNKFSMGLNETKLGIVAPTWFADTMQNAIGRRMTELSLQLGSMYNPEQALRIGMLDEIASDEDVMEIALKKASEFAKIPSAARTASKMLMRQSTVDRLRSNQDQDTDRFVGFCMQESVQRDLGAYMDSLKARKK